MKRILLIALAAITLQSASAADTLTVRINDETTADKLLDEIHKAGIDAKLPKPHECSEEKK